MLRISFDNFIFYAKKPHFTTCFHPKYILKNANLRYQVHLEGKNQYIPLENHSV